MGHYGWSSIDNRYSHLQRILRDFDWCIEDLTRHYIATLKATSSWYWRKSKATIGVKNTASYTPWLCTSWDQMVALNMIYYVFVLMTITITQVFCIKFKKCLLIILKLITHILKKLLYFSDGCGGLYKSYKNFMDLCFDKDDFAISVEWVFFATSNCKQPYFGGAVKRHVAKQSLQRSFNNQVLNYKAMLYWYENEMMSIKFFLNL